MDTVYIESDCLLESTPWSVPLLRRSQQPPSVIDGAEGLPNVTSAFFQARQAAAEQRRWLIVNLQHPGTKRSEALNLVWASPKFCEGVLVEECVLWQRDISHFHAEPFINYYLDARSPSVEDSPLVMMIDPRTGRALRRWKADMVEFPLDAHLALEQVNKFLEMHTLEGFSPPESPQNSPAIAPDADPFALDSADPPEFNLEEFDTESAFDTEALGAESNTKLEDEICKEDDVKSCLPDVVDEQTPTEAEAVTRVLSDEYLGSSSSPRPGEPIRLLLRWPSGSRSAHELMVDEPLSNIMATAAAGLAQHASPGVSEGAGSTVGLSEVLLETASPPLRELHGLPQSTPVGSLDLHRRVLNVRLRDDM